MLFITIDTICWVVWSRKIYCSAFSPPQFQQDVNWPSWVSPQFLHVQVFSWTWWGESISANSFLGSGIIRANGGNGTTNQGAGGGGRVALVYKDVKFYGNIEAKGGITNGTYSNVGGAGTIFFAKDVGGNLEEKELIIIILILIFQKA